MWVENPKVVGQPAPAPVAAPPVVAPKPVSPPKPKSPPPTNPWAPKSGGGGNPWEQVSCHIHHSSSQMRMLTYFRPAAEIPGEQTHHHGQHHNKADNQTHQAGAATMATDQTPAPAAKTTKTKKKRRKRIDLLNLQDCKPTDQQRARMRRRRCGRVRGNRVLLGL